MLDCLHHRNSRVYGRQITRVQSSLIFSSRCSRTRSVVKEYMHSTTQLHLIFYYCTFRLAPLVYRNGIIGVESGLRSNDGEGLRDNVQQGAVESIEDCGQGSEGRVEGGDLLEDLGCERCGIAKYTRKGKREWEDAENGSEVHRGIDLDVWRLKSTRNIAIMGKV
ncbi:hypothetical protein PMIN06_004944 [Paraphaeosphaeria minitans]